jgi:hypothetical protein
MTATTSGADGRSSGPTRGLRWLATPTTATLLGALALAVLLAAIPLEVVNPGTLSVNASGSLSDATGVVFVLVFASVGVVVARRQPHNPIGWLLLVATILWEIGQYVPSYVYVDYVVHHGSLPLGHVALVLSTTFVYGLFLLPLVILLFPDGRLGGRWRWPLRLYALIGLADVAGTVSVAVSDFRLRMPVDSSGTLIGSNHPHGSEAWANSARPSACSRSSCCRSRRPSTRRATTAAPAANAASS